MDFPDKLVKSTNRLLKSTDKLVKSIIVIDLAPPS